MSESEKLAEIQNARHKFDNALRGMERFIMNLDPSRVQVLRDWLRAVDADGKPDRIAAPPLEGWPLAEQIGVHLEAVLEARATWRKMRSKSRPRV